MTLKLKRLIIFGVILLMGGFWGYQRLEKTLFRKWRRAPQILIPPRVRVEPNPVQEKLVFLALGDTGSGSDDQRRVAAGLENRCQLVNPRAILLLGDNFYPSGVKSVDDPQWQTKFEDIYSGECLRRTDFFVIPGNHDYSGSVDAQIVYTEKQKRWSMPGRFYAREFGNLLQLIAYDSNINDICFDSSKCTIDFLRERLSEKNRKRFTWNIVMAHHPLNSASAKSMERRGGVKGWALKTVFCSEFDLWISGHAHHLEHTALPGCKSEGIISGGGGGEKYPIQKLSDSPDSYFLRDGYGFYEIGIEAERLTHRFFDADGQEIYKKIKYRLSSF